MARSVRPWPPCSRVDEDRALRGEHDVARPQVPVDPCGRTVVVVGTPRRSDRRRPRPCGHRTSEVPTRPPLCGRTDEPVARRSSDPTNARGCWSAAACRSRRPAPAGRRFPEGARTRGVCDRQCSAEVRSRGRGGECRRQASQVDVVGPTSSTSTTRAVRLRLGQPPQAGGLSLEVSLRASARVFRCTVPSCRVDTTATVDGSRSKQSE